MGLTLDAGDMVAADPGLDAVPGRERMPRESIDVGIEFAEPLGRRAFSALHGNPLQGADPLAQAELAIQHRSLLWRAFLPASLPGDP